MMPTKIALFAETTMFWLVAQGGERVAVVLNRIKHYLALYLT